ncbi:MAG: hypothetical protein IKM04_07925 [Clostridia bacterium]|nr:hypothetical protein [Clostridia bacterium]
MNKYETYKISKISLLLLCCCTLLLGAFIGTGITMLIYGGKPLDMPSNDMSDNNKNEVTLPAHSKFAVLSKKEDGDLVVVTTTYGSFSYPFAFTDVLSYEASTDDSSAAKLNFYADIDENKYILFTLNFGISEGIFIGRLNVGEEGGQTDVSVVFYDTPEALSNDELTTYYAAKELFNDIEQSLMKSGNSLNH